jgi:predicted ribonuclease YlaK
VLLAVPRRVVEELDARKYSHAKSRDRARQRIRKLASYVAHDAKQPRPGVDVEIVVSVDLDPDAARRPPIPADTEIIETYEALTAYAGANRVCLVTGDLSMQILAESRGIDVQRMPENTAQPLGGEAQ